MARQRMIQPALWVDDGFLAMSDKARLLWIGMINFADDEGRGIGSSRSLKAAIFPGDQITVAKMDSLKSEVEKNVRVTFYDVDGQTYYQIEKWSDYQQISHPKASSIPKKPAIKGNSGKLPESSGNVPASSPTSSAQLVSQLVSQLSNADSRNDPGGIGRPSAKRPPIPGVRTAGEALPPEIRQKFKRMKEKA